MQNESFRTEQVTRHFCFYAKSQKPVVMRSSFLFSYWNRQSRNDAPVIISSFVFSQETKFHLIHVASPDPFCSNYKPYIKSIQ